MDSVFVELLKQAPIVGALVVCVWIFLKYLKIRDDDARDALRGISKECHEVQKSSTEAVRHNTEVLSEMKGTMQAMDQTMRDVQTVIRKVND